MAIDEINEGAGDEPSHVRLTELGSGAKRVLLEGLTQGINQAVGRHTTPLTKSGQTMSKWLPAAIERILVLIGESVKDADGLEDLLQASEPKDQSLLVKELQKALRRLIATEARLRGMASRRQRRTFAQRLVRQIKSDVETYLGELEGELIDILRQRAREEERETMRIDHQDDPISFPLLDPHGEVVGILIHRDLRARLVEALEDLNPHEVMGLITYLHSLEVDDLDGITTAEQVRRWNVLEDGNRATFRQSALRKVRNSLRDLVTTN
ncbi:hypothetical protein HY523_02505 [Candidatus Berkelbacteria bacterium]|nr:hypothetical protein [Candidatus Berkelbacteria bacterium]